MLEELPLPLLFCGTSCFLQTFNGPGFRGGARVIFKSSPLFNGLDHPGCAAYDVSAPGGKQCPDPFVRINIYIVEPENNAMSYYMEKSLAYGMIILVGALLIRQLCIWMKGPLREGATGSDDVSEYKDPGMSKDPLYLATLNAANISWLKQQFDRINSLGMKIDGLDKQVESNSTAIESLNKAIAAPADDIPDKETTDNLAATGNTVPPGAE